MRIRRFRKEDARKASNIIKKCLIEVNIKDYSRKNMEALSKYFTPSKLINLAKERDFFVAVKNEDIIGIASLKDNCILTVFVNPRMHGRGIGSKLMDKIEELAKKKGIKMIKLPSSITSFEFYKKRGYKKIKISKSEELGDTIIMRKKL